MTTFPSIWQSPANYPQDQSPWRGKWHPFHEFLQPIMGSKSNTSGWFPPPLDQKLKKNVCSYSGDDDYWAWLTINFHTMSLPTTTAVSWAERVFKVLEPGYRFLVKWSLGCIYQSPSFLRQLFGVQESCQGLQVIAVIQIEYYIYNIYIYNLYRVQILFICTIYWIRHELRCFFFRWNA